jgi:hypothetical protein
VIWLPVAMPLEIFVVRIEKETESRGNVAE